MGRLPRFGEFRRGSWVPVLAKPLGLSSLFARPEPTSDAPAKDVCPRADSMENAFEPLRKGVGLIHMRSRAMLNVQFSGGGNASCEISEASRSEISIIGT